jgi:hypothetical protein
MISLGCASHPARTQRAPTPGQPSLSVMTFNVNYGLAGEEYATSLGWIHRRFDHIVYRAPLVPLAARVVHRGRSDHWPVVAVFEKP